MFGLGKEQPAGGKSAGQMRAKRKRHARALYSAERCSQYIASVCGLDQPLADLPADFQQQLKAIGYE